MVLVDDVVAGLEVLEDPHRGLSPGAGATAGTAAAGQLGLRHEGQPSLGQDEAPLHGRHDQRRPVGHGR